MTLRAGSSLRAIALIGALLTVAPGCGGHASRNVSATVVDVRERDFAIAVSPRVVDAGDVVFQDQNRGPDAHELIVIRSPDGALPLRSDGLTVDEEALGRVTVGAIEPHAPGSMSELHAHLSPGRYVLLCNMAGHYMGGMHAVLVVR
jgi:uncharacterized cupredoxin-like copper-binding protein